MSRFAQHTRLVAAPGKRDELVAKFLESAGIQRDHPNCELMLVSPTPDSADIVYLTEVWSSKVKPYVPGGGVAQARKSGWRG